MNISEDTGAMWAVLLVVVGLPALVYAGITRFTGHGRKGGPLWRPLQDWVYAICAAAAIAGHATASAVVTGSWGDTFGFTPTAVMGGCFSSALAYTCAGDAGTRVVRPALLLLVPYASALGFFGRIAG